MAGVARLSTMRNINVLVDKTGVLEAMKEELTEYPERLRKMRFWMPAILIYGMRRM